MHLAMDSRPAESAVVPAPYALPRGVPALQRGPGADRRLLVIVVLLTFLAGGIAGYLSGRLLGEDPAAEESRAGE